MIKDIVEQKRKVILCINKTDKVKKEEVFKIISVYDEYIKKLNSNFCEVIPISVFKGTNLDILIECIKKYLPEGEMIYDEDEITDSTEREIVEEIIREKALNNLSEEIPHGINVQVESFKERTNKEGLQIYDIDVNIICEKDSHKPIIIGKDGSMLKKIASDARRDIENSLDTKINLKIWVKVRPDWQENDNFLKNINKN
jgi:GTP-binding protein Era